MTKQYIFLSLLLVLGCTSCKKKSNKTGEYTISFQTQFQGADFNLGDVFSSSAAYDLKIETMQFYLADITFVDKNNEDCIAKDIVLLKIDDSGFASITVDVPVGKYNKLKFSVGVPKALNESDPADFSADHPLSVTQNTYWGWAQMYRFISVEGRFDIEPDAVFDGTFSYHTGYEESYFKSEFDIDLNMEKNGSGSGVFCIDLAKLFDNGTSSIDVTTESSYHGNYTDVELSVRLSSNFKSSIQMK